MTFRTSVSSAGFPIALRQRLAAIMESLRFGRGRGGGPKIGGKDLAFIFRNLAALVDNGVGLPKALATLARESTAKKHADVLLRLKRTVESGDPFSTALARYPSIFSEVIVYQVRAAERAGTLGPALGRIALQVERAYGVRRQILQRLAYPIVLVIAGALAVTFMIVYVIPVFQKIYDDAHVTLPLLTRGLVAAGHAAVRYGWLVPLAALAAFVAWKQARGRPATAAAIDEIMLRVPLFGPWCRRIGVLQFMEVFGNLIEAGFKVVDALEASAGAVHNRAIRRCVRRLQDAVTRGERFGRELDQMSDLFPPVVSQLIAVGEQTGSLAKATADIRRHLQEEVERQTNLLVGILEPLLTIALAAMVAVVLIAVYLPMFDMIGAVGKG
jgi:type IV pilus assembly protein PilC